MKRNPVNPKKRSLDPDKITLISLRILMHHISSLIQSFMETQLDVSTKHVLSVLVTQILQPRVVPKSVSVCVVFPRAKPQKRTLASPRADSPAVPFSPIAQATEAWKERQRIDTPQWQIVPERGLDEEQDSSEEDITDDTYLKMHSRSFDALRKENIQILNSLARKKRGSDLAKAADVFDVKKVEYSSSRLPSFNYDTSWSASKPWKKPKKFIEMVLNTPTTTPATTPLESTITTPQNKVKRARELLPPSKESSSNDEPQDLIAKYQVALLQLRYLHLRKQLAMLRQGSSSHLTSVGSLTLSLKPRPKTLDDDDDTPAPIVVTDVEPQSPAATTTTSGGGGMATATFLSRSGSGVMPSPPPPPVFGRSGSVTHVVGATNTNLFPVKVVVGATNTNLFPVKYVVGKQQQQQQQHLSLTSVRKTTRTTAGIRKKKLDEL